MKKGTRELAAIILLSGLGLAGGALFAAEFEVLDRFSVDGYTVLRGSADISGGSFSVGGSTFVIKGGNVGVGTTNPLANFEVAGGIKLSSFTICTSDTAGTLRWYDGHISVCNGSAWRQLDNQPPPTITSITPASGIVSGGTPITIVGTGFSQGLELTLGDATATSIALAGAIQITAVTPARTAGAQELKIMNSDGQYITGTFTYNPLPTSGSVSPASGTQGTVITITGTDFVTGLTVTIDGVAAALNLVTATQIVAVAPANASPGAKNITITNPDTGSVTLTEGFTYLSPTITGVTPVYGIPGTVFTITGTSFVNATGLAVTVGGAPAAGFTWNSATQITATAPGSAASGAKAVVVTNRDSGTATKTDAFTYTVYAAGGTDSGAYRIHTFNSGGTFTPATGGNVDYLVVAGGGGGGTGSAGAGGGGGGFLTGTLSVTPISYPITVGTGGAGKAGSAAQAGDSGLNSVFNSLTAIGGGGGGGEGSGAWNGLTGGSGGGGCYTGGNTAGSGTSGQGYAGGTGKTGYWSGGGGGAGGIGGSADAGAGNGGVGRLSTISGAAVYYAGGGGGAKQADTGTAGIGGNGGGGAGANDSSPGTGPSAGGVSGTPNTGGGGGGGPEGSRVGGNGGSGIVIVRYSIDASNWTTAPSLGSVSPASGATKGNYPITLTGSGFAAPAAVTIGGIAAQATTVNSGQIIAVVPALALGAKDVIVANPGGLSSTLSGAFTVVVPATGGTIDEASVPGYRIHTFTGAGSSTFHINYGGPGVVEALVVAGGGGGASGTYGGGAGGGGGVLSGNLSVTAGDKTVTVGGFGRGAYGYPSEYGANGIQGGNSVFESYTSVGGGFGGFTPGGNGGSGGGASRVGSSGGTGISGQGFGGGNGDSVGGTYAGGGGGGASAAGVNGTGCTLGGNGGQGRSHSLSGTAAIYGSGGGGGNECAGTPGTGGTGAGNGTQGQTRGTDATGANKGCGGGGGGYYGGGNGSDGIVIIRYPN